MRENKSNELGRRVVVIGLDGASFDLIFPWVDKGLLPNFAALLDRCSYGLLDPPPNMRSAASWTSFFTGKNPGKHGIYEFYDFIPSRYEIEFINGGICAEPTLWRLLSDWGRKVIVVNVPMTYPAEQVNGFLIAGLDAPGPKSNRFSFPPEIIKILEEKFGDYILEPGLTGYIIGGNIKLAIEKLEYELQQKREITLYLMDNYPWDFLMVVFRSLDAVQHCFWKYMDPTHPHHDPREASLWGDAILHAYKKVDEAVGKIVERLSNNALLFIMSDHGFGQKHPANNQLNAWLASKGYLTYHHSSNSNTTHLLKGMYRFMAGKTPRRYKEIITRLFPVFRDKVHSRLCFTGINWNATKAYSDTLFANIRINLKGREANGIVRYGTEYEKLVEEIRAQLLDCRDLESGEKIIQDVLRRDDIYNGPYVYKAPDLTIRWREDIQIRGIKLDSNLENKDVPALQPFIPAEDYQVISGDHRRYGVFFATGRGIKKGEVKGLTVMDITPTTLAFLGCPVPDDMDGRVIEEIFECKLIKKTMPAFSRDIKADNQVTYSDDDIKKIKKRLKGLGYIE